MRLLFTIAALLLVSALVVACQNQPQEKAQETANKETKQSSKEPEMYEASELAALMRSMYDRNLELGKRIEAGEIPESFPEDFYTIHSAEATPGMLHDTVFFKNMAEQYLVNMKKITEAENKQEAKIAYNNMIMTCAGCHQVYCQGPLPTIRKMKLSLNEETAGKD